MKHKTNRKYLDNLWTRLNQFGLMAPTATTNSTPTSCETRSYSQGRLHYDGARTGHRAGVPRPPEKLRAAFNKWIRVCMCIELFVCELLLLLVICDAPSLVTLIRPRVVSAALICVSVCVSVTASGKLRQCPLQQRSLTVPSCRPTSRNG